MLQPRNQQLQVWEVRHHSDGSAIDDFCAAAEAGARGCIDGRRLRGMQFTWDAVPVRLARPYRGSYQPPADLEVKPAEYTSEEAGNARLLVDRRRRDFLIGLAQARGKVRSVDTEESSELAVELVAAGLIAKEYLVTCRGDSRTIFTVPDRSALTSGSAAEFRCPVCGRSVSEEVVQEIYAVTRDGQRLVAGSRWMTIWVTELLEVAGLLANTSRGMQPRVTTSWTSSWKSWGRSISWS